MTVYLRIGKRHTSWETLSPEDIVRAEFTTREGADDLKPSLYAVGVESVIRVESEHLVSQLSPPPAQGRTSVDLIDLGRPEPSEGKTLFSLTRKAHAELILSDRAALLALVTAARADLARRRHVTTREQIYDFALGKLDSQDPEWIDAMKQRPQWGEQLTKWRKKKTSESQTS